MRLAVVTADSGQAVMAGNMAHIVDCVEMHDVSVCSTVHTEDNTATF